MICASCGNQIVGNAQSCPICGAPLSQGYPPQQPAQGYPPQQPMQGYPQGYQQPYAAPQQPQQGYNQPPQPQPPTGYQQPQYNYTGYPQGYQQPYAAPQGHTAHSGDPFTNCLHILPSYLRGTLTSPLKTLRMMVEHGEWLTGVLALAVMLLVSFIGMMAVTRGLIASVISLLAGGTGAESSAQIAQSASYIASRVGAGASAGVMLLSLCNTLIPAGVTLAYLCGIRRIPFSLPLCSSLLAMVALPLIAARVVGMLLGLISPLGILVALGAGSVLLYVILSCLISGLTELEQEKLLLPKALIIGCSLFVTLMVDVLLGGMVMNGVMRTITGLLGQLGSLL